MDDKNLMENLLCLEKGVCDLYLHGTIESSTPKVHQTFSTALNSALGLQDEIYTQMSNKGWYTTENAEQNKIASLKQKFANQACEA